jgi:hypothetical protein
MSRSGPRSSGFTANLVVEPLQTNDGSIEQRNMNNSIESTSDASPPPPPSHERRGERRGRGGPIQPLAPTSAPEAFNQTASIQQASVIAQGVQSGSGNGSSGPQINVVWKPIQTNTGTIMQENQNNSVGDRRGDGDHYAIPSQPDQGGQMAAAQQTGNAFNQTASLQQANVIIQGSTLPSSRNLNTSRSNRGSRR